ncbi:MAG: hypothetical protein K8R58_02105, partial [Bacteroidales bacterium]|nr:hypothetical protein [Bacteroidales bacterium]
SSPVLTDLVYERPFKNGIVNNTIGIYIFNSSIYLNNGYNDIYNDPAQGYYMQLISTGTPTTIYAANNYWGTTNIGTIMNHLDRPRYYSIEPILNSPQSSYQSPYSVEYEMLKSAYIYLNNEEYQDAESTFKYLIENYPETSEAYLSVSGLYDCYKQSNGNLNNYENYIIDLYRSSTTIISRKLLYSYLNLCKREKGEYSEAIENYESILLNNPSYIDSCYAVIDIRNTYREAGKYKSSSSLLSDLIPQSDAANVRNIIDILSSLKDEELQPQLTKKTLKLSLGQNHPDPFKQSTIIDFSIPYKADVVIKVNNVLEKEVANIAMGILDKGTHKVEFSPINLKSGIYFYSLHINGETVEIKKMRKVD